MRRALTFLALTGLSLASKYHSEHRKPTDAIIIKPFSNDNKPVQVPYGAMDDELMIMYNARPIYVNKPVLPEGKPVQVSHGAFDDDNEFRILFNPQNPQPILQKSFRELNQPVQVSHGAFDDELHTVLKVKAQEPVLGGKAVKTPYLENQKKFKHIQFPQPIPQEGKPVEVPYGALDDEFRTIREPLYNRPVQVSHGAFDDELHTLKVKIQEEALSNRRSFRPVPENYLENQKKFQYIQFPNPIVQEGKPVEVPFGAL